jgi:uncharacterized protein YndB with AHSA1/START domain
MIRLRHTTYIERPRSEVWETASIPENELVWDPDGPLWVEKLSDGPLGVGTRYRGKWKKFGTLEWTYPTFDPPHTLTHDAPTAFGRSLHFLTFEDLGGIVTRFDQTVELQTKLWARPLEPVLRSVLRRRMEHFARTLKEYSERAEVGPTA